LKVKLQRFVRQSKKSVTEESTKILWKIPYASAAYFAFVSRQLP
jgi:hypothetical protein